MTAPGFVLRMAWREARASGSRLLLLTAAITIGVAALVAIASFTDNLRAAVEGQSRGLMGGDVSLSARNAPDDSLKALLDSVTLAAGSDPRLDRAAVTNFSGMAYVPRTRGTRLVQVSGIGGGYPFYGAVRTQPAGAWTRLAEGRVTLVDPSFLTALGAAIGDTMSLGESRFVIAGTVTSFPGDVGIRSAFGPRVFIPARYLGETKLLTFGSRAEYEWFLRTPATTDTRALARTWRPKLRARQAGIRTAVDSEANLKEFLDQLGRYLGLVALIALLLGGTGVASAVQVFIRRKRDGIAVLRCLGATSGQVFGIYLLQAVAMGFLGSAMGVLLGLLLQLALPAVFGAFLPLDVAVRPSVPAMLTGLGVGVWVALVFALLPLLAVRGVPPLAVLRRDVDTEASPRADRWLWAARLALVLSVVALAGLRVASVRQGVIFAAAIGAALLVLWGAARGLTGALRRWFPRRLAYGLRQGLANLYRPANQTVAVVLALGFGVFLLGALAVMRHNLLGQLRLDGGLGRPNLVFFDVQPDQRPAVETIIRGQGLALQPAVPMVPMRIAAINGRSVATLLADTTDRPREGERPRRGERGPGADRPSRWVLRREFRSTYRDTPVASEKVVVGDWWAPGSGAAAGRRATVPSAPYPISMETGVASDLNVTLRDTITWDIQGIPVVTVIQNLREVNWARFEPNFFVVFPAGPLDDAPQSYVLLTRVDDPALMGRLQRAVVERHPNVTSIDLTSVQQAIEKIVASVALAIRFMALFTVSTGIVVLIGALATSRFQRIRESALLKTLGATRRQVIGVMVTEYAALGALAALVAIGLATLGGWGLMKWVFKVPFSVPWASYGLLVLLTVTLTVVTGLWTSVALFRQSALEVLRAE